jgi:hypothetical protein
MQIQFEKITDSINAFARLLVVERLFQLLPKANTAPKSKTKKKADYFNGSR